MRKGARENATVATTRTTWSSGSCHNVNQWMAWQKVLRLQSKAYTPGHETLLLVGDSITEEWGGSHCGKQIAKFADIPHILEGRPFGRRWDGPMILGISSDQTQHLLWRLTKGGELSPAMKADPLLTVKS